MHITEKKKKRNTSPVETLTDETAIFEDTVGTASGGSAGPPLRYSKARDTQDTNNTGMGELPSYDEAMGRPTVYDNIHTTVNLY